MKRLRFDIYGGFDDNPKCTERGHWVQLEGETIEDLAEQIKEWVEETGEELLESDDDD